MPGFPGGAEVVEQPGVEEGPYLGAVREVPGLPGVQRQGCGALGETETGAGESREELVGGDRAAAFGPGRVHGQDRTVDGQPVEPEGAAELG